MKCNLRSGLNGYCVYTGSFWTVCPFKSDKCPYHNDVGSEKRTRARKKRFKRLQTAENKVLMRRAQPGAFSYPPYFHCLWLKI